jgi:uracil-DNA glycosylase
VIYVPAEGPSNAKLAICGEAPGGHEEELGRPFVGPTGQIVRDSIRTLGYDETQVYYTNVVKIRPPGNNIDSLHVLGKTINDFLPQLHAEMEALKPNAILALGNTALEALTGHRGIEKYRGCIMPSSFCSSKVIPTIHPASLLHDDGGGRMHTWKDLVYIKWDFKRAIEQSCFSDYNPPRRNLMVCRSALELDRFLRQYEDSPFCSVDIETYHTFPICIGFAFNRDEAISIPLFNFQTSLNSLGMTRSDVISCWEMCARVLADTNIMKIGQNFKFDQRLLKWANNDEVLFGFQTNSFFFDTMLAFRTLYPELPATLQFISSVLTEEVYYKDEGKEYNPKRDKFDRLLLYNAKDAAVTYECFEKEIEELDKRGITKFFFDRVMPLHDFYSRLELRGIKRDDFQRRVLEEKYKFRQEDLQEELNQITSEYLEEPINVSSNSARGDVPKLLYGLMKVPIRKGVDEKTLDALMRNGVKDPKKRRAIELILEIRKVKKTRGTYIDHEVDYRGRTLTSVRIALETGRTSTGILKPPVTTEPRGLAFQTVTKHGEVGTDLRSMWVPDDGYVIIEPDLSGAEARVVSVLAADEKLQRIFRYDLDIHRITAGWIDGNCPDELLQAFFEEEKEDNILILKKQITNILKERIDNERRQIGKKFRHAGHYDMGKREAARQTGFSEWKTKQILDRFHATNPSIRGVFHKGIQECLRDNQRTLVSPHGRARQFFNKWGDDLFKEAYAFIPQATVSDHLKFAAQRIEKRARWVQIIMESHDSFTALIPIDTVDLACKIFKEELETPIDFKQCSLSRNDELIIPCEIQLAEKNWKEMRRIA